jgi:putative NADPH-quinone reductase
VTDYDKGVIFAGRYLCALDEEEPVKVTAVVGAYRRGGIVESAVDEVLAAAKMQGAEVEKVHLLDRHVEFCANCRACTLEPGAERGRCTIEDDVPAILDTLDASDVIVLASPVNFWTVTALMKRFIERTVCYGFWPWGGGPKPRRPRTKRAIVVASSAAPAVMARWGTDAGKLLRRVAHLLGAKRVDTLWIGLARRTADAGLPPRARARAQTLGWRVVTR